MGRDDKPERETRLDATFGGEIGGARAKHGGERSFY
jgi:hypothetical protein